MAHLPLATIEMTADVYQIFEIMISIVSFDYFQPTEYIDLNFTETPAYTENFGMLGYESLNFVEGLGSIIIFAFIQIFFVLIVLLITITKCKCPIKWVKKRFTKKKACLDSIDFINGTFFEILVCVSVSTFMLYIS